jgi:citrate lyase beta subunit
MAARHAPRIHGFARPLPVHALIETHDALRDVERIAAHSRVESAEIRAGFFAVADTP